MGGFITAILRRTFSECKNRHANFSRKSTGNVGKIIFAGYHVGMTENCYPKNPLSNAGKLDAFRSELIDDISNRQNNTWQLTDGQITLPGVFGFCRGVKRAIAMALEAAREHKATQNPGKLVLLGEIIHNPWVNDFFRNQGVEILTKAQRQCDQIEKYVGPGDCAIIPAFGVALPIERKLGEIGCKIVNCSCGDVIRLWRWSEAEVREGFSVLIFGKPLHDETVVTKSRLAEAGGEYIVVENMQKVARFAELIKAGHDVSPIEEFGADATNARSLKPFEKLAQVSQTTMLYNDTQNVREIIGDAFASRFGADQLENCLRVQPTVCRATQDRQNAAVELCQSRPDLVIVVGGFGSSNTRHLYELAKQYAPAFLIEGADSVISQQKLLAWNEKQACATEISDWFPQQRPIRLGILAGASSPEIVIGQVVQKLGEFLSK